MEIVEIWQNFEKNATLIMIFLPHYMWVEINKSKSDRRSTIRKF